MSDNQILTIITPVFNRGKLLVKLYESLREQKSYNFIWMVVDDGSIEDITGIVAGIKKTSPFEIVFHRKQNGGKHTALNVAFSMLKTELAMIADSDDILTPEATELAESKWNLLKGSNIAGMIFLKGYPNGELAGESELEDGIYDMLDVMFRFRIGGDKEEIFQSEILKKYRFPEYPGENYVGEDYVWRQIYMKFKMAYINKIIYLCDYLDDGLTKQGRKLRIKCPYGGMEHSKVSFHKRFPLKEKYKRGMLYVCYGKFAKLSFSDLAVRSEHPLLIFLCYIPGLMLYLFWKQKYMR